MRENYRYILARICPPARTFEAKEVYMAAAEAFSSLFGEIESARAWIAVMECSGQHAIFRFRRGTDPMVEAALASVCRIGETFVAIHPIRTSGTIRTLREERDRFFQPLINGRINQENKWYQAVFSRSGEIDLKEKGINLQIPLYITEEDIKDRYYDEQQPGCI
jgi:RNase P/RNase MRP subunit POP5